jgi:hypothetical protein
MPVGAALGSVAGWARRRLLGWCPAFLISRLSGLVLSFWCLRLVDSAARSSEPQPPTGGEGGLAAIDKRFVLEHAVRPRGHPLRHLRRRLDR